MTTGQSRYNEKHTRCSNGHFQGKSQLTGYVLTRGFGAKFYGPDVLQTHQGFNFLHSLSVSVLTAIFPGGPGLAGTRMSSFCILLALREMEVTTGAMRRAKLQSNRYHQQTNTQFFYRPDALPVTQPTV